MLCVGGRRRKLRTLDGLGLTAKALPHLSICTQFQGQGNNAELTVMRCAARRCTRPRGGCWACCCASWTASAPRAGASWWAPPIGARTWTPPCCPDSTPPSPLACPLRRTGARDPSRSLGALDDLDLAYRQVWALLGSFQSA